MATGVHCRKAEIPCALSAAERRRQRFFSMRCSGTESSFGITFWHTVAHLLKYARSGHRSHSSSEKSFTVVFPTADFPNFRGGRAPRPGCAPPPPLPPPPKIAAARAHTWRQVLQHSTLRGGTLDFKANPSMRNPRGTRPDNADSVDLKARADYTYDFRGAPRKHAH